MRAPLTRWRAHRVALLLAPILCAVWLAALTGSPVCCDAFDTLRMAVNLAHHGVMSIDRSPPYTPSMFREPVPVLSGAAMVTVVDAVAGPAALAAYLEGERARWLKAQNVLWLLLLCAFTYLAITSLTGSLVLAVGGALVAQAAFWLGPLKQFGADSLYTELPSAAGLMLGSLLIARAVSRAGWLRMGLVGVTFGVLALIKAATLYIFGGLVLVVAALWAAGRGRVSPSRAMAGAAMLLLGCTIVVAPWLARNYHTFGRLRIRDGSGMVLYFRALQDEGVWPAQYLGSFYAWSPSALRPTMGRLLGFGPADLRKGGRLEQLSTFPDSGFLERDRAAMFEGRPEDAVSYLYRAFAEFTRVRRQLEAAGVPHPGLVADELLMARARARILGHPLETLVMTAPVLWRSAMLTFPVLVAVLGLALWRRDDELLVFCLPALALVTFYALLSHGEPRYSLPVLPIAVVGATVLTRSVWVRRGWRPRPAPILAKDGQAGQEGARMRRPGRDGGTLALALGLALGAMLAGTVGADEALYRSRALRLVVGYPPGGGFDVYSRILGRHLGRHIAGEPTIVVDNMPGAGGLVAANHVYRIARPDGLSVGHFTGGLLLGPLLQQPGAGFDARRFEYVGAPAREQMACALSRASGIASVETWRAARTPVKMGGGGPGTAQESATRIVRAALELPIRVVSGYRGTADIRLAVDSGELAGACLNWGSMRTGWAEALRSGEVTVLLAVTPQPIPELPGVPLAIDLARTAEGRRLVEIGVHDQEALARPYVLPPGTPPARVRLLRQAFRATLDDPAFRAEAERARLEIDPVSGEELEQVIERLSTLEPELVRRLRAVLLE